MVPVTSIWIVAVPALPDISAVILDTGSLPTLLSVNGIANAGLLKASKKQIEKHKNTFFILIPLNVYSDALARRLLQTVNEA